MITANEQYRLIFGLKVKQMRQEQGWQLNELAERAGLSASYLNEIEKGKKYPKAEKIFALATALDTDYDTLVSMKMSKKLEPVTELLKSNILQELPLELFGIEPSDLLDILSEAPSKVSAFISTIIEISRNYGMNVEQFYFSALRTYQEMHNNYFDDIEQEAATFLDTHNPGLSQTISADWLAGILTQQFNYRIDEFRESEQPALAGIRSVVFPGSPVRLLINEGLDSSQRAFTYGRELGFSLMKVTNRPLISSITEAESFDQVLNNFRASYFAGAVLVPRTQLIAGLERFFSRPVWEPALFIDLMNKFQIRPELFMHRITNVMTSHFGIDKLFFLRFDNQAGEPQFTLSKELHLSRLHNPHGSVNEHYCHRWLALTLLQKLAKLQQNGEWDGQHIGGAQVSEYMDSGNRYLVLSVATSAPPFTGKNSSITIGFALDDKLRALVRFLGDERILHRRVNETCERCGDLDCRERVFPPVVWQRHRRHENLKWALEELKKKGG
jgi:XRE family transcriptional regulator, fatty acid utilization regulator